VSSVVSPKGYITISLPKAIADAIDELIEELGYWPSRGSFAREACLEKIREERRKLRELRKADDKDAPIAAGTASPPGD
jgi:Arc/MetJ-type ribon-helix-helix transcriptional regulator